MAIRLTTRLDDTLHHLAKMKCIEERRSLNSAMTLLLQRWVRGEVEAKAPVEPFVGQPPYRRPRDMTTKEPDDDPTSR